MERLSESGWAYKKSDGYTRCTLQCRDHVPDYDTLS